MANEVGSRGIGDGGAHVGYLLMVKKERIPGWCILFFSDEMPAGTETERRQGCKSRFVGWEYHLFHGSTLMYKIIQKFSSFNLATSK